tara:strand:- start:1124 stop:1438 length:315 start_codon:yes stop_codon:yes gene_type:complete
MTQVLKYWPVVLGVVGALAWLITGSVELGEMKSEVKHQTESAAAERLALEKEDARIHKRIDSTDEKVSRIKKKADTTSETVIRIETNQTTIIRNQNRILQKLEK